MLPIFNPSTVVRLTTILSGLKRDYGDSASPDFGYDHPEPVNPGSQRNREGCLPARPLAINRRRRRESDSHAPGRCS